MYIHRSLGDSILKASGSFPVIMLTGPRQVGKTTLLREIDKKRNYVTLDNLDDRSLAKSDPAGFLQRYTSPLLIDEVQYAPELFSYIKIVADKEKQPGMFWLTGSQQFELMKNVTESMAGRVAIFNLLGLSLAEELGQPESLPFVPKLDYVEQKSKTAPKFTMPQIYHKIWRGSYPFVVTDQDDKNRDQFYQSYISTYIQRDIRDFMQISEQDVFLRFMQIAAARTGQIINYADFARDVGVTIPTIKSWITALRASGIVYILQPYFNNRIKRLVKTPKFYFLDTGLCSYLSGWPNPDVLERGAMSGAILETYVLSEIIKSYYNNAKQPRLFYYRDKDQSEIDLLIESGEYIYPVEVKKTATPSLLPTKSIAKLQKSDLSVGDAGVICLREDFIPLSRGITAIPVGYI